MLPDQAKGQPDQEWMSKRMYSIIPDLHADPQRLTKTLLTLGQDAPLAFLGDFIDGKGLQTPDDLSVLRRVKFLIESGEAVGVMGNHELNAILFHRNDARGRPLRAHTADNKKQHRSFIDRSA